MKWDVSRVLKALKNNRRKEATLRRYAVYFSFDKELEKFPTAGAHPNNNPFYQA
jgi:hypothetical protein